MKSNLDSTQDLEPTTSVADNRSGAVPPKSNRTVTAKAVILGLLLTGFLAWFNCLMSTQYQVFMIGGIQMPYGAIFVLMVLALGTLLLRRLNITLFSAAEMLTIYAMLVFGTLISTPGADNVFMVAGPTLFYFSKPENGWAQLFYKYIPSWFSPGWNGEVYKKAVIDPIYLGGVAFKDIPWDAWTMMLIAWSIFFVFLYALMFFTALLLRKQWTQREALAFPLVEVPIQMAETEGGKQPSYWTSNMMWIGFGIACFIHLFKGMNAMYPDWPIFPVNTFNGIVLTFTEKPLNVIPRVNAQLYLGGIGLAYLLTREVSFSFWFFYLFVGIQLVGAEVLGFSIAGMQKSGLQGYPDFVNYQMFGGWIMMAIMLVWTAREYLTRMAKEAFTKNRGDADEPFSPRVMVFGFILSFAGLLGWSWFAGINIIFAFTFFGMFWITSLVLTRIVIEGGFMFPQPPYYVLEGMNKALFGTALDTASLTKLGFIQPAILVDMRTSLLPAFLHTMKIAEVLRLDRKNLRRLLFAVIAALVVTFVVMIVTTISILYSVGGLQAYSWFSHAASEATFQSIASTVKLKQGVDPTVWPWIAIGAGAVYLMLLGRSRFLWFPFHPLGYLMATGYPIKQLWFSLFLGWGIKSLVMKYGGSDTYVALRPFMVGLILGNVVAMLFWVLFTFFVTGSTIGYWPA